MDAAENHVISSHGSAFLCTPTKLAGRQSAVSSLSALSPNSQHARSLRVACGEAQRSVRVLYAATCIPVRDTQRLTPLRFPTNRKIGNRKIVPVRHFGISYPKYNSILQICAMCLRRYSVLFRTFRTLAEIAEGDSGKIKVLKAVFVRAGKKSYNFLYTTSRTSFQIVRRIFVAANTDW